MRHIAAHRIWLLLLLLAATHPGMAAPASQPTEEPKPKWETTARWFGNLSARKRSYATREPGGFGMALSSPNLVHDTDVHVVIREEVSNFAARRAVVESITWSSTVGDLYYQNKDGSHVAAGSGGSGGGCLTESDLADPHPVPPEVIQNAEERVQEARQRLKDAEQRLAKAQEKLKQAQKNSDLLEQEPVKNYRTALQQESALEGNSGERNAADKARAQVQKTQSAFDDYVKKHMNDAVQEYSKTIAPMTDRLKDTKLGADERKKLMDELHSAADQYKQDAQKYTDLSEFIHAENEVNYTAPEVERARRELLAALGRLEDTKHPGQKATAIVAIGEGSDRTPGKTISLSFTLDDKKLVEFPIDVIPLKLTGFKTVLKKDYKPTITNASSAATSFNGQAPIKQADDPVTLDAGGKHQGGQPGLIGGGESQTSATFKRLADKQQLFVRGRVLHRVRMPHGDGDVNLVMPQPNGPPAPGAAETSSIQGSYPVAGSVTVEAWVIDPKKPPAATQPADVAAATNNDGRFELAVPRAQDKLLRLRFTYYSKAARLWEFQTLEVSTNDLLTAAVGATSSAAPAPSIDRSHNLWYRYGNAPMELPPDVEHGRGATVRREGDRVILSFEGLNSILMNTFILKTPYLNQNNQAFDMKATVPVSRLLAARPSFIDKASVAARLGAAADAAPQENTTDVKVRGSVVCYPTCLTMLLGGYNMVSLSGDGQHSDEVRNTAQAIYDYWGEQTRKTAGPAAHPPPPWVFPFPDSPSAAEALWKDAQAQLASANAVTKLEGEHTRDRALALYNQWPYVQEDKNGLNKQWLISIGKSGYAFIITSTGSENLPISEPQYRPWQASEIVRDYLRDKRHLNTTFSEKNVFDQANGQTLVRALGGGALSVISIVHRDSTGAAGGHILVVLGVVTDNLGLPVRIIVHDPYGDQTQHPGIEGYYNPANMGDNSLYDKDRSGGGGGTLGQYAPYGPEINSFGGSLRGKWWVIVKPPADLASDDAVHKRLLPSERWNGGEPK